MKDSSFYTNESGVYSERRYPKKNITFTQFFFTKRLSITLFELSKILPKQGRLSLLEIGPADGVVVRRVWETFPNTFINIDAVDASPGMVKVAKERHARTPINFALRTKLQQDAYDVVLETGVVNYLDYKQEFSEVASALKHNGTYILTIAGTSSLQNLLKGNAGYQNLLSYSAYEQELQKRFTIERSVPVGFFVPFLWRIPILARAVQPLVEVLLHPFSNLALEKLYVLKRK